MRTTVDLDPAVLALAKRLARSEGKTLGSVLSEALGAYLATREQAATDRPFELIVRGHQGGRFPSPAETIALEEDEEFAPLRISETKRSAAS